MGASSSKAIEKAGEGVVEKIAESRTVVQAMSGFEVLALVNLILVLVTIGLVTYVIVRLHRLWRSYDSTVVELKTVIGRMVREINVLNAKKYVVDTNQTTQIKEIKQHQL